MAAAQSYKVKDQEEWPMQPIQPEQLPPLPDSSTQNKELKTKNKEQKDIEDTKNYESNREKWKNRTEFFLSCMSLTIGFGNIWRLPFVALENGGGAFFISYLLVLLFIGCPLYYMELIIGQFTSCGVSEMWELVPAFKGKYFSVYASAQGHPYGFQHRIVEEFSSGSILPFISSK